MVKKLRDKIIERKGQKFTVNSIEEAGSSASTATSSTKIVSSTTRPLFRGAFFNDALKADFIGIKQFIPVKPSKIWGDQPRLPILYGIISDFENEDDNTLSELRDSARIFNALSPHKSFCEMESPSREQEQKQRDKKIKQVKSCDPGATNKTLTDVRQSVGRNQCHVEQKLRLNELKGFSRLIEKNYFWTGLSNVASNQKQAINDIKDDLGRGGDAWLAYAHLPSIDLLSLAIRMDDIAGFTVLLKEAKAEVDAYRKILRAAAAPSASRGGRTKPSNNKSEFKTFSLKLNNFITETEEKLETIQEGISLAMLKRTKGGVMTRDFTVDGLSFVNLKVAQGLTHGSSVLYRAMWSNMLLAAGNMPINEKLTKVGLNIDICNKNTAFFLKAKTVFSGVKKKLAKIIKNLAKPVQYKSALLELKQELQKLIQADPENTSDIADGIATAAGQGQDAVLNYAKRIEGIFMSSSLARYDRESKQVEQRKTDFSQARIKLNEAKVAVKTQVGKLLDKFAPLQASPPSISLVVHSAAVKSFLQELEYKLPAARHTVVFETAATIYEREFWRLLNKDLFGLRSERYRLEQLLLKERLTDKTQLQALDSHIDGKVEAAQFIFAELSCTNQGGFNAKLTELDISEQARGHVKTALSSQGKVFSQKGLLFLDIIHGVASAFLSENSKADYAKFVLNPFSPQAIHRHARRTQDLSHVEGFLHYMRAWLPKKVQLEKESLFLKGSERFLPAVLCDSGDSSFLIPSDLSASIPQVEPENAGKLFWSSDYLAYHFFKEGSLVGRINEFGKHFEALEKLDSYSFSLTKLLGQRFGSAQCAMSLIDVFIGFHQAVVRGGARVFEYQGKSSQASMAITKVGRVVKAFDSKLKTFKKTLGSVGKRVVACIIKDLPEIIQAQQGDQFLLSKRKFKQLKAIVDDYGSSAQKKQFNSVCDLMSVFPRYKDRNSLAPSRQWLQLVDDSSQDRLNAKQAWYFIDFAEQFSPEAQQEAAKLIHDILSMTNYPSNVGKCLTTLSRLFDKDPQSLDKAKALLIEITFYLQEAGDIYDEKAFVFIKAVKKATGKFSGGDVTLDQSQSWKSRRNTLHDMMTTKLYALIDNAHKHGQGCEVSQMKGYTLRSEGSAVAKSLLPLNLKSNEYRDYRKHLTHLAKYAPSSLAGLRVVAGDQPSEHQGGYLYRCKQVLATKGISPAFAPLITVLGDKRLISSTDDAQRNLADHLICTFGRFRLDFLFAEAKKRALVNRVQFTPVDKQFVCDNMRVLCGRTDANQVDDTSVLGVLLKGYNGEGIYSLEIFEAALGKYDNALKRKNDLELEKENFVSKAVDSNTSNAEVEKSLGDIERCDVQLKEISLQLPFYEKESKAAQGLVAKYAEKRFLWLVRNWQGSGSITGRDQKLFSDYNQNKVLQEALCRILKKGYDGSDGGGQLNSQLVQFMVRFCRGKVAVLYAEKRLTYLLAHSRLAINEGQTGVSRLKLLSGEPKIDMNFDQTFFSRNDSSNSYRLIPGVQANINQAMAIHLKSTMKKSFTDEGAYNEFRSKLMVTAFYHFRPIEPDASSLVWESYCMNRVYDLLVSDDFNAAYREFKAQLALQSSGLNMSQLFKSNSSKAQVVKYLKRYVDALPGKLLPTRGGKQVNQRWHGVAMEVFDGLLGPDHVSTKKLKLKWFAVLLKHPQRDGELVSVGGDKAYKSLTSAGDRTAFSKLFGAENLSDLVAMILECLEDLRQVISLDVYKLLITMLKVFDKSDANFPAQFTYKGASKGRDIVSCLLQSLLDAHKYTINIASYLTGRGYPQALGSYSEHLSVKSQASAATSRDAGSSNAQEKYKLSEQGVLRSQALIENHLQYLIIDKPSMDGEAWCVLMKTFKQGFLDKLSKGSLYNTELLKNLNFLYENAITARALLVDLTSWMSAVGQPLVKISLEKVAILVKCLPEDERKRWAAELKKVVKYSRSSANSGQINPRYLQMELLSCLLKGIDNSVARNSYSSLVDTALSQPSPSARSESSLILSADDDSGDVLSTLKSLIGLHSFEENSKVLSDEVLTQKKQDYSNLKKKIPKSPFLGSQVSLFEIIADEDWGVRYFDQPLGVTMFRVRTVLAEAFTDKVSLTDGLKSNIVGAFWGGWRKSAQKGDCKNFAEYLLANLPMWLKKNSEKYKLKKPDDIVSEVGEVILKVLSSSPFTVKQQEAIKTASGKFQANTVTAQYIATYRGWGIVLAREGKRQGRVLKTILKQKFGLKAYLEACKSAGDDPKKKGWLFTELAEKLMKLQEPVSADDEFGLNLSSLIIGPSAFEDAIRRIVGPGKLIAEFIPRALSYIQYHINPYRERGPAELKNMVALTSQIQDLVNMIDVFSPDSDAQELIHDWAATLFVNICCKKSAGLGVSETQSTGSQQTLSSRSSRFSMFSRKSPTTSTASPSASLSAVLNTEQTWMPRVSVETLELLLRALGSKGQSFYAQLPEQQKASLGVAAMYVAPGVSPYQALYKEQKQRHKGNALEYNAQVVLAMAELKKSVSAYFNVDKYNKFVPELQMVLMEMSQYICREFKEVGNFSDLASDQKKQVMVFVCEVLRKSFLGVSSKQARFAATLKAIVNKLAVMLSGNAGTDILGSNDKTKVVDALDILIKAGRLQENIYLIQDGSERSRQVRGVCDFVKKVAGSKAYNKSSFSNSLSQLPSNIKALGLLSVDRCSQHESFSIAQSYTTYGGNGVSGYSNGSRNQSTFFAQPGGSPDSGPSISSKHTDYNVFDA